MSVILSFTRLSTQTCVCERDIVCVCVRLDGHGRQLELHCSSSLAVINWHVSFPMVSLAWWRQSSPWRAPRVLTAIHRHCRPFCHTWESLMYTLPSPSLTFLHVFFLNISLFNLLRHVFTHISTFERNILIYSSLN